MNDFNNPAPIATPEQYRAALLAVRERMTPIQLKMLQAHCRAEGRSISIKGLAHLLDLPATSSAPYRTYARWIADALKYQPSTADGKQCWWLALAYGRDDGKVDGDYQWIMRPELAGTLKAMNWA